MTQSESVALAQLGQKDGIYCNERNAECRQEGRGTGTAGVGSGMVETERTRQRRDRQRCKVRETGEEVFDMLLCVYGTGGLSSVTYRCYSARS